MSSNSSTFTPSLSGSNADSRIKAYIPDDELVWIGVEIIAEDPPGIFLVEIIDEDCVNYPRKKIINIKQHPYLTALPLQNDELSSNIDQVGVDDRTVLNYLHEPSIMDNLRRRFLAQLPYTYTGEICVAINPYKWLPLYTTELREAYANHLRHELKPHVYAISATAYQGLSSYGRNQSILVSGESGAGKTETVKILMGHLASISGKRNSVVIDKVLQANPLMETFGNAKTTRNDNSSRFGKFTRLQFDSCNMLAGSKCVTYLLEKSRIVNQNPGERNYHIFHEIFCAPAEIKVSVHLGGLTAADFLFTNAGDTETNVIEGVSDGDRFKQTLSTLSLLGVDEATQQDLLRVIAGVLYLGQVCFVGDLDQSSVDQEYAENLSICCDLLGLAEADFCTRTTTRSIEAEGRETIIHLSRDQAFDSRDALAKDIYDKLFRWLVLVLNGSTAAAPGSLNTKTDRIISLLDIFGFETFDTNRFEQLCINFANEKLQQKFTADIFQAVQAEYKAEGLEWENIGYKDNAEVLDLFEGRLGVIALLNEECLLPNGNDLNFLAKLQSAARQQANSCFLVPAKGQRDEFGVAHFAGSVTYSVCAFIERNRDTVPVELTTLLTTSSQRLLRDCYNEALHAPSSTSSSSSASTPMGRGRTSNSMSPFKLTPSTSKKGFMKADTVTTKFRAQLDQLMQEIGQTTVQYVRCIKPNGMKSSEIFDRPMIVNQLRCAGMIEAIRISRAAYPYRVTHVEFLSRFAHLRPRLTRRMKELASDGERCGLLLADIWPNQTYLGPRGQGGGLSNKAYEVGRTKVYFSNGVLEAVEKSRGTLIHAHIALIQSVIRGTIQRRLYSLMRKSAVRIQAQARGHLHRLHFRKQLRALVSLQTNSRRQLARWKVRKLRRVHMAAVAMTSWFKTKLLRRRYLIRIAQVREDKQLKKKIDLINAQLEEERLARTELERDMFQKLSVEKEQLQLEFEDRKRKELELLRQSSQNQLEEQVLSETIRLQENLNSISGHNTSLQESLQQEASRVAELIDANAALENELRVLRLQFETETLVSNARVAQAVQMAQEEARQAHQLTVEALQRRLDEAESTFSSRLEAEIEKLTTHMQEEIEEETRCVEAQARDKLENHKIMLQAQLESQYKEQIEQLQMQQGSEDMQVQLQALETDVVQFAIRENELRSQLESVNREKDDLQCQLAQLHDLASVETENTQKVLTECKRLKEEMGNTRIREDALVAASEQLKVALKYEQTVSEKLKTDLTSQRAQALQWAAELESQTTVFQLAQKELAALTEQEAQLRAECERKDADFNLINDRLQVLEAAVVEVEELNVTLQQKSDEIQRLKDQIIEMGKQLEVLKEQNQRVDALQQSNAILSNECESLKGANSSLEAEVIMLKIENGEATKSAATASLNAELVTLRSQLEESLTSQKIFQMQNEQYQKRLEDLSSTDHELKLERQNRVLLDELRSLKELHDELMQEVASLKRTEPLSLGGLKDRRQSDLYSELIALRAKNEILTKEIATMKRGGGVGGYASYPPPHTPQQLQQQVPESVLSPTANSAATSTASAITLDVDRDKERELALLRKEKELYVVEKRVLLEMLSSQCDEMDAVESARKEVKSLLSQAQGNHASNKVQVVNLLKAAKVASEVIVRVEELFKQSTVSSSKRDDDDDESRNANASRATPNGSSKRAASRGPGHMVQTRSKSPSRTRSKSPGDRYRSSRSPHQHHRASSRGAGTRSRSRGRRVLDRDDSQSMISSVSTHKTRDPPTPSTPKVDQQAALQSPSPRFNFAPQPSSQMMQLNGTPTMGRPSVGQGMTTPPLSSSNAPTPRSIQANQGIPSPVRNISSVQSPMSLQSPKAGQYPAGVASPSVRAMQGLQQSLQFQPPRRQQQQQQISSPQQQQQQQQSSPNGFIGASGGGSGQGRPIPPHRAMSQQMPSSRLFNAQPTTPGSGQGQGQSQGQSPIHGISIPRESNNNGNNNSNNSTNTPTATNSESDNNSSRKKADPNFWAFF